MILQALHAVDIPVIPLKGAWLSENIYDEGAQRPMCDFDLLVPLDEFDRARAAFETLGYTTPDHYFDPARDKDIHFFHSDHPMTVELHFRIWDSGHLADQIARLLEDDDLHRRLSEAGPRVAAHFSVALLADRVLGHIGLGEPVPSPS